MAATAGRSLDWAPAPLTEGDVLAAFAAHCREALEDVEVLDQGPTRLVARWRRETSAVELLTDPPVRPLAAQPQPTLYLLELRGELDGIAERFAAEPALRASVGLADLVRLEKIATVRSSVFVYFEWFLRDAYGVRLLTSAAFTRRLIARGQLHLGFG
ncbi:MAG: hypothetical protein IT201_01370 [Thermoleophilia bacterium]|nr:hypothetical protein [Thermoleophilia bacterium]